MPGGILTTTVCLWESEISKPKKIRNHDIDSPQMRSLSAKHRADGHPVFAGKGYEASFVEYGQFKGAHSAGESKDRQGLACHAGKV